VEYGKIMQKWQMANAKQIRRAHKKISPVDKAGQGNQPWPNMA